jgi:hypothetical protein
MIASLPVANMRLSHMVHLVSSTFGYLRIGPPVMYRGTLSVRASATEQGRATVA